MTEPIAGRWISQLEGEIARELGQPVTVSAGGDAPAAGCLQDVLILPGATLTLASDPEGAAAILTEGRVIEAGQADPPMVQELWSGILASVAARLGGKPGLAGPAGLMAGEPCTLHLGAASMRMSLAVQETGQAAAASVPAPPPPIAERPPAERNPAERPPVPEGNYDLLLQVELDASVSFGSRELALKELLDLGPGDVVELDRHVTDPVDLIIGDKIVARGEVVLVNGNFGLRVTEVAEPVRRLESIRWAL